MRRWRWIGHTLRKPHNNITRQAPQWNLQGNRGRGWPRETWKRYVERKMTMIGKGWGQLGKLAQDRRRSVFHIAYHLFQTYDLIRTFRLDTVCLLHFLSLVEANYHESNPYHNAVHAADVTQSMHCFLQEREICNATSDMEKMIALVAALTHDLDHPGVNNAFLIVTANHLATLYENISVLENHHFRCAVALLQESGLLNKLADHEKTEFYRQLKELILATDITRQPEFLQKFCVSRDKI
ncbi:cAMP-specific 3',5'-cyclic phosphodiesterase [Elysia marginata]|uniref:cAMP-specific 3',5'-cyclic phosphodiesterase n=1 Tax=Elysia marginata TaxID=1093978 RepID=A0AAV4GBG0_9GAST|nr:cAMP-specific 3',5'-cyclic phosphodiesterase [Elysia marginata]